MEKTRLELNQIIALSILFSILLLVARVLYFRSFVYVFLIWNIFLALIPYIISSFLLKTKKLSGLTVFVSIAVWLLFFPNAPYIITDLIHLNVSKQAPTWFDVLLILSFAWNGMVLAFISLMDVQTILKSYMSRKMTWGFVSITLLLSGFGIYLGRFLRWNSWDVITNPLALFSDIFSRLVNPILHPRTWIVTILFFIFFFLGYLLMLKFSELSETDS